MNTNKHESGASFYLHEATISILEAVQLKGFWQAQWKLKLNYLKAVMNNQLSCLSCLLDRHSRLAKAGSWLKNIRVHWCSSVVPNLSVYSVYSVVKNGGAQ